jgi:glycerophosphoryl diester phosphodiesterase
MTLVVAHRGASAAFPPGNTLEAFVGAVDQSADWVELDVHLTADGQVVVHHDPVLGDGRLIGELSTTELPSFVPSLREVMQVCGSLSINVEIKPDGPHELRPQLIDNVVSLLNASGEPDRYLVTSFDHDIVDAVRGLAPLLPTGLLLFDGSRDEVLARAVARGHVAINPWAPLVDDEFVERAHSQRIAVNVWTVDDPDQIRQLQAMGVDAIITNVPRLCRDVLNETK